MNIDLTVRYPVNTAESISEVPGSRIEIRTGTGEIGEVFGYRRNRKLPSEQIDFVQEEDDRFPLEPLAICQRLEKHHGFVHLVLDKQLAGVKSRLEGLYGTYSTLVFN